MLDFVVRKVKQDERIREFREKLSWYFFYSIVLKRELLQIDKFTNFKGQLFQDVGVKSKDLKGHNSLDMR